MGGTAEHVQRRAAEEDRSLRRLEVCNGREGRAWEGQPRVGARATPCGREGGKSVGGTATRRQGTCSAVRPRKEGRCDAWKRAMEGRAWEEGSLRRLEACNGREIGAWGGRPRVGGEACSGRERRAWEGWPRVGRVQRRVAKGKPLRRLEACSGRERRAWEGLPRVGRARAAPCGRERRSLRRLEACNGRESRAWEGRPHVGRARATPCGRGIATLGSVQRKGERSVGGTATRRQGTCSAVSGEGKRTVATLACTEGREERGREGHASAEHVQRRAAEEERSSRLEACSGRERKRGRDGHA